MNYKQRSYITFHATVLKNTEFDLETAYNATKTNSEKIRYV